MTFELTVHWDAGSTSCTTLLEQDFGNEAAMIQFAESKLREGITLEGTDSLLHLPARSLTLIESRPV